MSEINIGDYIEFFIESSQLDMPGKGDLEEAVHWAVEKAYGDAKRTMTGIGKFEDEKKNALDDMRNEFKVFLQMDIRVHLRICMKVYVSVGLVNLKERMPI